MPTESASADNGVDGFSPGNSVTTPPEPAPSKRSRAHYLWAVLIVRIYEVYRWYAHCAAARFALLRSSRTVPTYCKCSITLECRLSRQTSHQRTGPPLWKGHGDAQVGAQVEPEWDLVGQPAPYYDVDQGVNW